jgi:hypothetical protein
MIGHPWYSRLSQISVRTASTGYGLDRSASILRNIQPRCPKGFHFVTAQQSPFARKLGAFVALSVEELSALDRLHGRRKRFAAGRDMVHQGHSAGKEVFCQPQAEQAAALT